MLLSLSGASQIRRRRLILLLQLDSGPVSAEFKLLLNYSFGFLWL